MMDCQEAPAVSPLKPPAETVRVIVVAGIPYGVVVAGIRDRSPRTGTARPGSGFVVVPANSDTLRKHVVHTLAQPDRKLQA